MHVLCICLLHVSLWTALIPRHLVLRGNSLPGGFWVLCAQYKPRQVVQELAGSFCLFVWVIQDISKVFFWCPGAVSSLGHETTNLRVSVMPHPSHFIASICEK